jgi:hypothetical protein
MLNFWEGKFEPSRTILKIKVDLFKIGLWIFLN